MCLEFCLINSKIQTIWKDRTKILSAFEKNRWRIKWFREPGGSDVDKGLIKWFKQERTALCRATAGLTAVTKSVMTETVISAHETTQCHNPEDHSPLENLKSYIMIGCKVKTFVCDIGIQIAESMWEFELGMKEYEMCIQFFLPNNPSVPVLLHCTDF